MSKEKRTLTEIIDAIIDKYEQEQNQYNINDFEYNILSARKSALIDFIKVYDEHKKTRQLNVYDVRTI